MPTSGSTEKAGQPGKLPRPLSRPLRIAKLVAAVATCGVCCVWATSPVATLAYASAGLIRLHPIRPRTTRIHS